MKITLRYNTPQAWIDAVLADFDTFLADHAAAEKKASGMAVSMLSHYPDREALVTAMADLAVEEMAHLREVLKIMQQRGVILGNDSKDAYVNRLRKTMRQGTDVYMLDRLLIAGIIEARGCERFALIAQHVQDEELRRFYEAITESEARHESLFVELAELYFPKATIEARLNELLDIEANICAELPITAALH